MSGFPLPADRLTLDDALRARVVHAALLCGFGCTEVAAALSIGEASLRSWLRRWTGKQTWPEGTGGIEAVLALPVERPDSRIGPLSRLVGIAEDVAGLARGVLAGKSRCTAIAQARQAVCWAIRTHYGERYSFPRIGAALGGRNHSTIIYAVQAATARMARDAGYAALCHELLRHAGGTGEAPRRVQALPDWAEDPRRWLARRERRRMAGVPRDVAAIAAGIADIEAPDAAQRRHCERQRRASGMLLAALRREHGERCGAASGSRKATGQMGAAA